MRDRGLALSAAAIATVLSFAAVKVANAARRPIAELTPTATIRVGKTADWVAISDKAVWVGSTEPDAVSQIDPQTNTLVATVRLPGNPCAGLAIGHGGLWLTSYDAGTISRIEIDDALRHCRGKQ